MVDGILNSSNRPASGELGEHRLTLVRAKSGHHLPTRPRFYLSILTTGAHYRLNPSRSRGLYFTLVPNLWRHIWKAVARRKCLLVRE